MGRNGSDSSGRPGCCFDGGSRGAAISRSRRSAGDSSRLTRGPDTGPGPHDPFLVQVIEPLAEEVEEPEEIAECEECGGTCGEEPTDDTKES